MVALRIDEQASREPTILATTALPSPPGQSPPGLSPPVLEICQDASPKYLQLPRMDGSAKHVGLPLMKTCDAVAKRPVFFDACLTYGADDASSVSTCGSDEVTSFPTEVDGSKSGESAAGDLPFEGVQQTEEPEPIPSIGSMGHPHCCAGPCPFRKKKGGCKAGLECMKCHVCKWSRAAGAKDDNEQSRPALEHFAGQASEQQQAGRGVSIGTLGHPYSCSGPCKYVWRKCGCKMGAACRQCHLCPWEKRKDDSDGRPLEDEAVPDVKQTLQDLIVVALEADALLATRESAVPESQITAPEREKFAQKVLSVGTKGHPYTCGLPCKFAMKEKGCKDGHSCTRCHLCRWKSSSSVMVCLPVRT